MNEDLRQWLRQKWVDISRKKKGGGHPACGASADKGVRAKDSSKKYPKCVPANKAKNMSKKQKKSAVTRKRRAPNEPGSPDFVKTDVKKENWEKWHPRRSEVYMSGLPSNNAPVNPEPMGGAAAFEKSRKEVLSQLEEVIRLIVIDILNEDTVPGKRIQGRVPAAPATRVRQPRLTEELKTLFNDAPKLETLDKITDLFLLIMRNSETDQYADIIDQMAEQHPEFNRAIENLVELRDLPPNVAPKSEIDPEMIIKVWGKMANAIEAIRGETHISTLFSQAKTPPTPAKTKTKPTQTLNLPSQSERFIKDVGDYRKLVADYVSSPNIKQNLINKITNIQFDTDMSEPEKEGRIYNVIEPYIRTNMPRKSLNEVRLSRKVKYIIIKSVLKEQGIYG